jgi:hypothetical protein
MAGHWNVKVRAYERSEILVDFVSLYSYGGSLDYKMYHTHR